MRDDAGKQALTPAPLLPLPACIMALLKSERKVQVHNHIRTSGLLFFRGHVGAHFEGHVQLTTWHGAADSNVWCKKCRGPPGANLGVQNRGLAWLSRYGNTGYAFTTVILKQDGMPYRKSFNPFSAQNRVQAKALLLRLTHCILKAAAASKEQLYSALVEKPSTIHM